jgi:hypothetical protein
LKSGARLERVSVPHTCTINPTCKSQAVTNITIAKEFFAVGTWCRALISSSVISRASSTLRVELPSAPAVGNEHLSKRHEDSLEEALNNVGRVWRQRSGGCPGIITAANVGERVVIAHFYTQAGLEVSCGGAFESCGIVFLTRRCLLTQKQHLRVLFLARCFRAIASRFGISSCLEQIGRCWRKKQCPQKHRRHNYEDCPTNDELEDHKGPIHYPSCGLGNLPHVPRIIPDRCSWVCSRQAYRSDCPRTG